MFKHLFGSVICLALCTGTVTAQAPEGATDQTAPPDANATPSDEIRVEQRPAEIIVTQPEPVITVTQAPPVVLVEQCAPNVTVTQAPPKVTVTMPQPVITMVMPDPLVTKGETAQNAEVISAEPIVTFVPADPKVIIKEMPAEIDAKEAAPEVTVIPSQEAEIHITQPDAETISLRQGAEMVALETLGADDLQDVPVYDAQDIEIGKITDLLMAEDGEIEQVIVQVNQGERNVALPVDQVSFQRIADGGALRAYLGMPANGLEQLPEYTPSNEDAP